MIKETIFRFFRFGAVGFSGVFVDFGITFLLRDKLGFDTYLSNTAVFASS